MLRLPSHRDIAALFYTPNTTAGATKVLSDTAKRLDAVSSHHCDRADLKAFTAAHHRIKANILDDEVFAHQREAGRAASVAAKLEALLS